MLRENLRIRCWLSGVQRGGERRTSCHISTPTEEVPSAHADEASMRVSVQRVCKAQAAVSNLTSVHLDDVCVCVIAHADER